MVQASARSWIDAFFFRASAIVSDSEGERMVLNMEHTSDHSDHSPDSHDDSGWQVDYSAIVAREPIAQSILTDARMMTVCRLIKQENTAAARETQESTSSTTRRLLPSGFFVVEAKPTDARPRLMDHISQAVSELYACATVLQ
ncbi:hypothetical protein BDZ89DRAFT_455735 [Hymenopellis radicata]|nr:hypothetical protein BDZ89DRAFT_455735 [Hymenopellis radicata]